MTGLEMHPGWEKRFDARPEPKTPEPPAERSYCVGLPVVITVRDDGTVTYEVCSEEAGQLVREEFAGVPGYEDFDPDADLDSILIDRDHDVRMGRATLTESETP